MVGVVSRGAEDPGTHWEGGGGGGVGLGGGGRVRRRRVGGGGGMRGEEGGGEGRVGRGWERRWGFQRGCFPGVRQACYTAQAVPGGQGAWGAGGLRTRDGRVRAPLSKPQSGDASM